MKKEFVRTLDNNTRTFYTRFFP